MEYLPAIKRNEIVPFAEMWTNLGAIIQSEVKSEREKQILYFNMYIWNIEKWNRWTYLQSRDCGVET